MLQNIREKLQGWIAVAVLLIIAVPLALTFVSSDFTVTSANFAARVNGEDIPSVDFQRVYQNQLVERQEATGDQLPAEAEEQLKRSTLDGLVLNRVVTQYVRDEGYRVGAERVIQEIRSQPVFQVGGQFSKPAYDATLAAQGISPQMYESQQQSLLAIRQLQDGLVESAFFTPAELRRLIALDQERRDVAYVLLDPRELGAGIAVSDADIQAYYSSNPAQFQSAESATLEYVEISLADMARDYVPDEAAIREAYEADPTRFRTAEERRARHILITVDADRNDAGARTLADDIAARLAKGEDFAALASQYSGDPGSAARGGDLGFAAAGNYVEAFDKALFALQAGETSQPVKTEFGYHIIRLDEVRAGAEQPLDQVRGQLSDELRQRRAQDEFYALAERVDDLSLENPTSLEPVARDTGLTVRRYEGFTRAGGGPLGNSPDLVRAVFSPGVLDGTENAPLIELDETRAVVARVAEYKAPAPLPLEQVKAQIIERVRALRASTEAAARGERIVKRVEEGADFGAAVAAEGLKAIEAGPLTRRSVAASPELLADLFRAPKPAGRPVVRGAALPDGAYAVFQIRTVEAGDPERIPLEQRDGQRRALAQRTAANETEALASNLREAADVVVAPDLFKAEEEELEP
jgi:peptidyl-prolyl cis-trans isomerase D